MTAYSDNLYAAQYQGPTASMGNAMGYPGYDAPTAGAQYGSSAALDMYPNPYAPVFTNPEQNPDDLQSQRENGMNILGTLPPDQKS